MNKLLSISEFVKTQIDNGLSKTAAVNLAVAVTGISPRSAWRMVDGDAPTSKTVARLLTVFSADDIPKRAKKRIFPEAFS